MRESASASHIQVGSPSDFLVINVPKAMHKEAISRQSACKMLTSGTYVCRGNCVVNCCGSTAEFNCPLPPCWRNRKLSAAKTFAVLSAARMLTLGCSPGFSQNSS